MHKNFSNQIWKSGLINLFMQFSSLWRKFVTGCVCVMRTAFTSALFERKF